MFSELRLATRLSIGFGVLTLGLVVIAGFGAFDLWQFNSQVKKVANIYAPAQGYLLNADRDLQQALVAERTLLLLPPDSENFNAQVQAHQENIQQAHDRVEKYAKLVNTPESNTMVVQYRGLQAKWSQSTTDLVNQLSNRPSSIQLALLTNDSMERIDAEFNDMRSIIDEIGNHLSEQIITEAQQAQSA